MRQNVKGRLPIFGGAVGKVVVSGSRDYRSIGERSIKIFDDCKDNKKLFLTIRIEAHSSRPF